MSTPPPADCKIPRWHARVGRRRGRPQRSAAAVVVPVICGIQELAVCPLGLTPSYPPERWIILACVLGRRGVQISVWTCPDSKMGANASSSASVWTESVQGEDDAEMHELKSFVICRLTPEQDRDPSEPLSTLLLSRGWCTAVDGGSAYIELGKAPVLRCERNASSSLKPVDWDNRETDAEDPPANGVWVCDLRTGEQCRIRHALHHATCGAGRAPTLKECALDAQRKGAAACIFFSGRQVAPGLFGMEPARPQLQTDAKIQDIVHFYRRTSSDTARQEPVLPEHYAIPLQIPVWLIQGRDGFASGEAFRRGCHCRLVRHVEPWIAPSFWDLEALRAHGTDAAKVKLGRDVQYPLHLAVLYGAPLESVAAVFRSYPQAATTPDKWGYLPLHYACECQVTPPAGPDVVFFLATQAPQAVTIPVAHGEQRDDASTALGLAVGNGSQSDSIVRALLTACPDAATTIVSDALERIPVMYRFLAQGSAASAVTCRLLLQADPDAATRPHPLNMRLSPLQTAMQASCNADVIELLLELDRDAAGTKEAGNRVPLPIFLSWVGPTSQMKLVPSPLESIKALHAACPAVCLPTAGAGALHCALEGWAPIEHLWWLLEIEPDAVRRATRPIRRGNADPGISGPLNHPPGALPLHCAFHQKCNFNNPVEPSSVFWVESKEGMHELVAVIAAIIAAHPDALHHQNSQGDLPLHLALRHRYPAKLVQLLCSETAACTRSSDGKLPFAQLLERGIASGVDGVQDRQLLHELVRLNPAVISAADSMNSCEPLYLALATKMVGQKRVLINPVDVITWVISLVLDAAGPSIIMRDNHVLHRTLVADGLEAELVVQMLATAESVAKKNNSGECSLHIAAGNHCSTSVLRHLDALGRASGHILASWATDAGLLPLHSALRATAQDCDCIKELHAMYPEAVTLSTDGNTCLHLCLQKETPIEITRFILQKYPQATAKRNSAGKLPFHVALRSASLESVRLVLEANPSVISDPVDELFPMFTTVQLLGKCREMKYLRDFCLSDLAADRPLTDMTQLSHNAKQYSEVNHRQSRHLRTSVVMQAPGQSPISHYSLTTERPAEAQKDLKGSAIYKSLVELYCKHYGQLNDEKNDTSVECGCSFGDSVTATGRLHLVRNAFGLLRVFADCPLSDFGNAKVAWVKFRNNAEPLGSLPKLMSDVTGLEVTNVAGRTVNIRITGVSHVENSADQSPTGQSIAHISLTIAEGEDGKVDQIRSIWQARGKSNPLLHTNGYGDNALHVLCKKQTGVVATLDTYLHCTCLMAPAAAAHLNHDGKTPFALLASRSDGSTAKALQCLLSHYPQAVRLQDQHNRLCLHNLLRDRASNADLLTKVVVATWPTAASIPYVYTSSGSFGEPRTGGIPLHMAIRHRKSHSCARALFKAFPQAIDMPDSVDGLCAVHMACASPAGFYHSNSSSDPALLQFCLEADKMAGTRKDRHGLIALCHVCQNSGNARHSERVAKCASMLLRAYPDTVKELWPTRERYEAITSTPRRKMLPLHAAIAFGISPDAIQILVDAFPAGCTIPCVDRDGSQRLPLELALSSGANADVLRILCRGYKQAIFMPLSSRSDYQFPLHAALAHGCDVTFITELLSTAAEKQVGGATTHRLGVATGVYHSVTKYGAEMAQVPDQKGRLPLHISLQYCAKVESILQVLQAFPDAVTVVDNNGMLPVHIALGKDNAVQAVLPILKASAPVHPDGNYGRSLLHWACRHNYDLSFIEQLTKMDALGDKAASTPEKSGELPLHCLMSRAASSKPDSTLFEYLLALNPAAVSTTDGKGRYPLHRAVERNEPQIVVKLLKMFPEAAAVADKDGRCPLHHCIASDSLNNEQTMDMIKLLLKYDRSALKMADVEGLYPLYISLMIKGKNGESNSVAAFLREQGSPKLTLSAPRKVRVKIALQMMRRNESDHLWDEDEVYYEDGEEGEDYGGLSRDFFREWGERMSESDLFRTVNGAVQPATDAICAVVQPDEHERKRVFHACGRCCGLALFHGYLLGLPLARCFLRLIMRRPPQGVKELQAELNAEQEAAAGNDFRGSSDLLSHTLSSLGLEDTLTFTRTLSARPEMNVELKPGGAEEVVTDETKADWLESTLRHKLVDSIEPQSEAFRAGVFDVVPPETFDLFEVEELAEVWSGSGINDIQLLRWKQNASFDIENLGENMESWFWEIVTSMTLQERSAVYKFATGSSRVATSEEFEQSDSEPFRVLMCNGDDALLPIAHTCSKEIEVPKYTSKKVFEVRLRTALEWGVDFGFG